MSKIIDLDHILISPVVYVAWQAIVRQATAEIVKRGIELKDIPVEQARVEDDGSLTIFVDIPRLGEVSLTIPPDQWAPVHEV